MKYSIKEHNNGMMITDEDIVILYSRVTYTPMYESIAGISFKDLTEQTIEILGGVRTKLKTGNNKPGIETEQRKYNFPGQKGTLEASTIIRTQSSNSDSNVKPYEDIELIVGLYEFDKDSSFYKKLVNAIGDLQRYKKQTLIYNWLTD